MIGQVGIYRHGGCFRAGMAQRITKNTSNGASMAGRFDTRILLAGVIVLCWTYLHLEARKQRLDLIAQVSKWQNEAQALRAWRPKS